MKIDNTPQDGLDDNAGLSEADAEALGSLFLDDDEEDGKPSTPEPDAQEASQEEDEGEKLEASEDDEDALEKDEEENDEGDTVALSDDMKITLDDGTETTVEDLKKSYFRHSHFTQRTQEVLAEKKQYEESNQRVQQLEQTIAQERWQMAQVLKDMMPEAPDQSMLDDDPIGYMKAKETYEQRVNSLRSLSHQDQLAKQRLTQEEQQAEQRFLQEQRDKMLDVMPELKTPEKLHEFSQKVQAVFAPAYGFTAEEIATVKDHRFAKVMADAMKYQELQKSASRVNEKVEGKPPMLESAPRQGRNGKAVRSLDARIAKAQQSGSADSVTDILGELLA